MGSTTDGKTTAQIAAGSVWGGGDKTGYVESWRSTKNGLELLAETHSDSLLILDELAQIEPAQAVDAAYTLANGQGKTRMSSGATFQRSLKWLVLVLSSGEIPLADHIGTIGAKSKGGQQIRLLDVPSNAGAGMGVFEDIQGAVSPETFADQVKEAALQFYGTPIRTFVKRLIQDFDASIEQVRVWIDEFLEYTPPDASAEVRRAGRRFALVAAAGRLATQFGITGWDEEEAFWGVWQCVQGWIGVRGTTGSIDADDGVRQVLHFIQSHGASRFEREGDKDDRIIQNRAGFIRANQSTGEKEYLFLTEVFRREVCKGHTPKQVLNALIDAHLLRCDADGHFSVKRLIGEQPKGARYYAVVLPEGE